MRAKLSETTPERGLSNSWLVAGIRSSLQTFTPKGRSARCITAPERASADFAGERSRIAFLLPLNAEVGITEK